MQHGLQRLSLLQIVPAVIFGLARFAVVATAHTGDRAAAAPGIRLRMIGGGGHGAGDDLLHGRQHNKSKRTYQENRNNNSEKRREGKECISTWRSRWATVH